MLLSKELKEQLNGLASFMENVKALLDAVNLSENLKKSFQDLCDNALKLKSDAEDVQKNNGYYDFRLNHLLVKNFRKYGSYEDEDLYTGLYALGAQMLYLLGNNGSGKSSMFNAAEYIFTKDISEARYRCYANLKQYIRHEDKEPVVKAFMKNGAKIELGSTDGIGALSMLPLSSFFISEYSIYKTGNKIKDVDFLPYICELLGIGSLYDFAFGKVVEDVISNLESIQTCQNESDETVVNNLKAAIDDYCKGGSGNDEGSSNAEDTNEVAPSVQLVEIGGRLVLRKIDEMSGKLSNTITGETEPNSSLFENVVKAAAELLKVRKVKVNNVSEEDVKTSIEQLKLLKDNITTGIVHYVNEIVDDEFKDMVNRLFDRYSITDGEKPEIHNIEGKVMHITSNGVSVVKYFNTFRFRMFFLIMQTACCLKLMKKYKVLFPIFMDDIFYANDYHNKAQLKGFFEVVLKYVADNFADNSRPQLIFFSHDEQIILSLQQSKKTEVGNIRFGKVLSVSDLSHIESTKQDIKLEKGRISYHNIYIEIFK